MPARAPRAARVGAWVLTLPLLAPLAWLFAAWGTPQAEIWNHLREFVLPAVVANTAWLALTLAVLVTTLGIALAWLSARCEYPGRAWLDWALVLPLAMPGYVAAFAWVGLLDYAGPVQGAWRVLSGSRAALPDVRSVFGAACVLSLVLYPYVYLLARAAFLRQGAAAYDAARSLGHGPVSAFVRVALPLAKPAWLAGLVLALLETLADFGTVSILGVDTFTTAIYKTWYGLYSLPGAAQLSCLLLVAVALALLLETLLRGRGRAVEHSTRRMPRRVLGGWRAAGASMFAFTVFALGFAVPAGRLVAWAIDVRVPLAPLLEVAGNTVVLGGAVALAVVVLALALALLERRAPRDPWLRAPIFLANLGYAVPGTVLAVATMLLLLDADRFTGVALSSSAFAIVAALTLRFLRVGFGAVDAGLHGVRSELIESARVLGVPPLQRLRRIVVPLLRPSLLAALLLVGVEAMKEMPATLMLRPFGWDTLAVKIYGYTSEGLWQEAAWPALLLVAAGLLPVRWLVRMR